MVPFLHAQVAQTERFLAPFFLSFLSTTLMKPSSSSMSGQSAFCIPTIPCISFLRKGPLSCSLRLLQEFSIQEERHVSVSSRPFHRVSTSSRAVFDNTQSGSCIANDTQIHASGAFQDVQSHRSNLLTGTVPYQRSECHSEVSAPADVRQVLCLEGLLLMFSSPYSWILHREIFF